MSQVKKGFKHACTSQPAARVSHQMEGIIEIEAHQADGVDPAPPQTLANLNPNQKRKPNKVKEGRKDGGKLREGL